MCNYCVFSLYIAKSSIIEFSAFTTKVLPSLRGTSCERPWHLAIWWYYVSFYTLNQNLWSRSQTGCIAWGFFTSAWYVQFISPASWKLALPGNYKNSIFFRKRIHTFAAENPKFKWLDNVWGHQPKEERQRKLTRRILNRINIMWRMLILMPMAMALETRKSKI